jgi:ABC-2 type transport system permease protein
VLDSLRLYGRYAAVSLRSQMQYRTSFIMLSLSTFAFTGAEFAMVWVMFRRFGTLQGWLLQEVATFYGTVHVAFAIAESSARGFDTFSGLIKGGGFDIILLRPRSAALQVAARELHAVRVGRLLQGVAILVWASVSLDIGWTLARSALLVGTILGAVCLFYGLLILQATLCFWTTESLEVLNTVTYGGIETAQYPMSIYRRWFRVFFTAVVPLACVSYYPLLRVLGRPSPDGIPTWFGWVSPLVGAGFLALSLQVWRIGVRHYRSTGS